MRRSHLENVVDTKAETLGVAIVGCGYWGVNYVRVFSELAGARVVAICDPRKDRLREVGRRFPEAALTTALEEALQLEGIDAAIVCTGATTHYEVARRCLMAGKHLLVEKPLATAVGDAEALIGLAESQGVTIMVGHTFLYGS
jgi:predicted dehydrogenase